MGFEKVAENIRAQGQAAADATRKEAEEEAQAILDAARKEADTIVKAREEELEQTVESLRRRELAGAELTAKKRRLNAEREVLASVREALEARVRDLPKAERERHVKALVEKANVPDGRVLVAAQDEDVAADLGLAVAGTFEGLGGVVVETPDGAISENLQYENVLDEVWRDALHDVAEVLFPEGSR